jgi:flagellar basal body-associated protein FliL
MTFCPTCGTQLKGAAPSQAPPTEPNKGQEKPEEKHEHPERAGKKEKAEHDFVYFLASGLILITIAVFAMSELTNPALMSGQYIAIMLVIIGLIVVLAAVYATFSGRKSFSSKLANEPDEKQPIKLEPQTVSSSQKLDNKST